MQTHWQIIAKKISEVTKHPFAPDGQQSVGGGSISSASVLSGNGQRYFVKINQSRYADMFAAEFDGLMEMAASNTIAVPKAICYGEAEDVAFIAMEALDFYGGKGRDIAGNAGKSTQQLGRDLAAMHRVTKSEFGWHRDNTIGSTPQLNQVCRQWVPFWRDQRLGYQLELAAHNGHTGSLQRRGERLLSKIDDLIEHEPEASLLHGDLWSGNYSVLASGQPVIYDPAVYYGDRETDIAMTELFGGFDSSFYAVYNESYPLDSGYAVRKMLYNLYHILNHLNLFGDGYLSQSQTMIDKLLSEV